MINCNCPECGKPIDGNDKTCPYCGARFVDMTSVSLNDSEPFYLMVRFNDYFRTAKVKLNMWEVVVNSDSKVPISLNLLIESAENSNYNDEFIQAVYSTWEHNRAKETSK